MKFRRDDLFAITKKPYKLIGDKSNGEIVYSKWVNFIDAHPEDFIWYENTKSGKYLLANIDEVPEDFKERVSKSLNKCSCLREFDVKKGYYNINAGFNFINNRVEIDFDRTPKLKDFKIFLSMAKHLDALLLRNGKEIIDESYLEPLS